MAVQMTEQDMRDPSGWYDEPPIWVTVSQVHEHHDLDEFSFNGWSNSVRELKEARQNGEPLWYVEFAYSEDGFQDGVLIGDYDDVVTEIGTVVREQYPHAFVIYDNPYYGERTPEDLEKDGFLLAIDPSEQDTDYGPKRSW